MRLLVICQLLHSIPVSYSSKEESKISSLVVTPNKIGATGNAVIKFIKKEIYETNR